MNKKPIINNKPPIDIIIIAYSDGIKLPIGSNIENMENVLNINTTEIWIIPIINKILFKRRPSRLIFIYR